MRLLNSSGSMLEEVVRLVSGYWCLCVGSVVGDEGFVVPSGVGDVDELCSTSVRCIVLRRGRSRLRRSTRYAGE